MNKNLSQISQDLVKEKLESYWPNFDLVAFALYDTSNVYLFNHPKFKQHNKFQTLKRDHQFNGCTLILYEGYPTAIVDVELYDDYEGLYSIFVHELFHGFQYLKGERRFPDEIIGLTYPLSKENVELRNRERAILFDAMLEDDIMKKKQYLNTFISLREKRAANMDNYITYENLVETIEGPAWYVELKAYSEKSTIEHKSIIKKYGHYLIDKFESTLDIRKSCYSSGLVMCLLLDDFLPDWKEGFWDKPETLYDLLKQNSDNIEIIRDVEISAETEKVINFVKQKRNCSLESFEQQNGIHLFIEGEIKAISFDPMNIVPLEDRLLHKNFIKVRINNIDYLIQQPVIAHCKDGFRNITTLHLILQNNPIENIDSLTIEGIGVINGSYKKQENGYTIICE
ncbi:hypothetical protein [Ornithinibacillus bavariensis]|uniref:Peptide ABC transporter permease n=1 Tax=Ornithinibacillus bavariensis TaxID=545502 RepID=A0A919XA84_9BACI|nr:hypothetical protein [Ornithinibacillus bavariensis]GIO28729.1 hypothetical protein J43TS3_33400 [Ornithinibacillus bavariensis]